MGSNYLKYIMIKGILSLVFCTFSDLLSTFRNPDNF